MNMQTSPNQASSKTIHDLRRLRRLVYQCQFLMQKTDRIIYGTPLIQTLMQAAMWFTQSYESRIPERKMEAADRAVMWFSAFRADLTAAVEENLIKFPKRRQREGMALTAAGEVNSRKIELVELVAKIDDGMHRWRSSLERGQNRIRRAYGKDTAADIL